MQTINQLFQLLLKDIQEKMNDEFDRNFERNTFFAEAWNPNKHNSIGLLMIWTGALRKSLRSEKIDIYSIWLQSLLPYAELHNSGKTFNRTKRKLCFCLCSEVCYAT